MSNIVVFNGLTDSLEVATSWFLEGDFIYLEAFNIGGGEIELDAFLNAVINGVTRVIPLERVTDIPPYQANKLDTELLFSIPSQFREANINKRIVFYPSEPTELKITVVINERAVDRIEEKLQEIEANVAQILNILSGGGVVLRGVLSFNSSTYSINEDGTIINPITIVRTNGSDGVVTVTLTPSNGTAVSPDDFDDAPIVVSFASGETVKTVTLSIVDDTIFEGNETINLALSNPTGGATLGSPEAITAVLTIVDNDVQQSFVSTWDTTITAGSVTANNQIRLPLVSQGAYNFTVDWGDNTSDNITVWNQAETTHTYSSPGIYTVTITGTINGWRFVNSGDKTKITDISAWGPLTLSSVGALGEYFHGCSRLNVTASDSLNLTGVTVLASAFRSCTLFNGNINNWDVSNITNTFFMFFNCSNFNQPLNNWNTSKMTNISNMFLNCSNFNQPLNNWDTSRVTNMSGLFQACFNFNQPLNNWNTSQVTNMGNTFSSCTNFNQPLNNWNTSQVTNMGNTFSSCTNFNQPLNTWNTSKVTNMVNMFSNCTNFNQDLSSWCVTLISTVPSGFDNNTPAWQGKPGTLPQWGTCP